MFRFDEGTLKYKSALLCMDHFTDRDDREFVLQRSETASGARVLLVSAGITVSEITGADRAFKDAAMKDR